MSKKDKLIPELRFPEFGKDINSHKKYLFKDIFLFGTGKNIKQSEASPEYKTPCVRYGELYHMYNEVIYDIINRTNINESELLLSQGNEILLPSAGEDPLDIGSASALTIKNVAIGRTINILSPKEVNLYSQKYVAYYINQKLRRKISTLAKGSSISNVYNSDLRKLKIVLPYLPEQQEIASFLSTVDKKINLLESKIEHLEQYKKGVVQKIFKQEIRFKITNEEDKLVEPKKWRRVSLNEVAEKITKKNVNDKFKLVLTNSAKHGILKQGDFFDKEIANQKNLQGYTIVQKGDFVYNPRISSLAPVGPIGMNHISVGVMSPLYTVFRFSESIDTKFYECYFNSTRWYKYLRSVANYGARHDRMNISSEDFFNLPLPFPEKEEQTKIANFLSKLDQKIDLHKEQLEKMKTWKKGLLQKMFV